MHSWDDNFQMLKEYSSNTGTTRIPAKTKYKGYIIEKNHNTERRVSDAECYT